METLRRLVRDRLGYKSRSYQAASRLYTDAITIAREGFRVYVQMRNLRNAIKPDQQQSVPIKLRNLSYPLLLRPGTHDIGAALNNVVREEYGRHLPKNAPTSMVDAGAYIGDTSAYFLSRFPDLKVWAIEPNPASLEMARRNLAPYGDRVRLIPAALCGHERRVRISGRETGVRIDEGKGVAVEVITIPNLLSQIPGHTVDILKLDIEGAEDEIFADNVSSWLPKVGMIILETHGPEITSRVLSTLRRHVWNFERYRNLYFCRPDSE